MESCVFVCEDFPKENQKQANEQLILVKLKIAIFYNLKISLLSRPCIM